jgi:broad specificity phosphatase PhoE
MSQLLLIRHAQASFGAADYDRLSPLGEEQARLLGTWLAECGPAPAAVVTGSMQRHRHTAAWCMASFPPVPARVVAALDEVDHVELLARLRQDLPGAAPEAAMQAHADPQRAFQDLFEAAVARWLAHGDDYALSWPAFRARVLAGFASLQDDPAHTTWVFTSGGPIAVIVNALLGAPADAAFALAWPLVNTGITCVRIGARGATLESFNGAPHLQRQREARLITHR